MKTLFSQYIQKELLERCQRNPAYSLRSLGKSLSVPPSSLSEWMSGKRAPKMEHAESILKLLECPQEKVKEILWEIKISDISKELMIKENIEKIEAEFDSSRLEKDIFKMISNWYCYAIVNLVELENFEYSVKFIVKTLGITEEEAQDALKVLLNTGILVEESGTLKASGNNLSTQTGVPDQSIRDFHRQILSLAQGALGHVPVQDRDFTNIMMPINVKSINQVKKEITTFRRKICKLLENGEKTEVYNLSIQLFPVTGRSS